MTNKPEIFPLAARSAGAVPHRRRPSIRRTTTLDVTWPEGFGGPSLMRAAGRDFLTDIHGDGRIIDTAAFELLLRNDRTVLAASSDSVAGLEYLVGARAGGASRKIISQLYGALAGQVFFQLLDDFAGASLVSGWAWSRWLPDWEERTRLLTSAIAGDEKHPLSRDMTDICVGFAKGSSALDIGGSVNQQGQSSAAAGALTRADDPDAWHSMVEGDGPAFRRARWFDLWLESDGLAFEGGFQDSSTTPKDGRRAVHEYRLDGKVGAEDLCLAALNVHPQVLPYRECPGAAPKAARMIGQNIETFRQQIIEELRGINGCTHLNDMLRALSDMGYLSQKLRS